jgi:hypothetical protein
MRCVVCNRALNNFESTRKSLATGDYLDICNKCIDGLGINTIDRDDLNENESVEEDFDWDDFEVEPEDE